MVGTAAALVLTNLGAPALHDWDEATYATVARGMLEGGSWLSPTLGGRYFPHKPPLLYWMMALSGRLFGPSEFAFRLPSALAAVIGVYVVMALGRRLGGRGAGLLAGIILATAPQWLRLGRQAMLDVPLAVALAVAFLGLVESSALIFGVAFGVALLVKGPAALTGLAVAGAWAALSGRRERIVVAKGAAIGLLIAAPWHLQQLATHGRTFLDYYLGFNVLGRILVPLEGHGAPPWFYLERIFTHWLNPWHWIGAIVVVAATRRAVVRRFGRLDGLLVLAVWIPILLFSLAKTRLAWYIEPVYPPLAVLTACGICEVATRWSVASWTTIVLVVVTLGQSVAFIALGAGQSRDAEQTRAILAQLPPVHDAPILFVMNPIPYETARFYARRPLAALDAGASAPVDAWILARPDDLVSLPGRAIIASGADRVLLGPRQALVTGDPE